MSGPVSSTSPWPSVTTAQINSHTIQALVELVYCQTANNVITGALASLQQALATTQNSLATLTQLQNLKNSIAPVSKSTFPFDYKNTSSDDYSKDYNSAASAFFGTPISVAFTIGNVTIVSAGSPGFASFTVQLDQCKSALQTQIAYLSSITDTTDPNTLYANLKKVYSELPSDTGDFGDVSKWVIDNNNTTGASGATTAGNFQVNLTAAITAGQSLNSSQQQRVQNYLFIFQEYYQSAAAVLTAIEQIISRMAQAAGR